MKDFVNQNLVWKPGLMLIPWSKVCIPMPVKNFLTMEEALLLISTIKGGAGFIPGEFLLLLTRQS